MKREIGHMFIYRRYNHLTLILTHQLIYSLHFTTTFDTELLNVAQSCQMMFPDYVQLDEEQMLLSIRVQNHECKIFLFADEESEPVIDFGQSVSYQSSVQLMSQLEEYMTPGSTNLLPLVTCVIQSLETLQANQINEEPKVEVFPHLNSTNSDLNSPRRKPYRDVPVSHFRKPEVDLTYEGNKVLATIPKETKKSTFFATIYPAKTLGDVHRFINFIDQQFPDAAHNIAAWRITQGDGAVDEGADDDGETGASAFMLFVLQQRKVQNAVVVCTRFFGGVLLGPLRFRLISEHTAQAVQLLEGK